MGAAPTAAEDLATTLARHGVALFERAPGGAAEVPEPEEYARLLARLARAEARFQAAVPCLLALHDGESGRRAVLVAAEAEPALASRLGLLYRLARALSLSRAPDLERLLGRVPALAPLPIEPGGADPSVRHGEAVLAEHSERSRSRGEPDFAGGVARAFDTWLRIAAVDRASADRAAVERVRDGA